MEKLNPEIPPSLFKNRKDSDRETVYEVTTQETGLPFGIAIADIDQSVAHSHRETIETYTVVQGDLEVSLDGEKRVLHPGDVIKIEPGMVHSARSLSDQPARITVTCVPEFSAEDYFETDKFQLKFPQKF